MRRYDERQFGGIVMITMAEIVEKLRDVNQVSNNLPLEIHLHDNGGGLLVDSLDNVRTDFNTIGELVEALNEEINSTAFESLGD